MALVRRKQRVGRRGADAQARHDNAQLLKVVARLEVRGGALVRPVAVDYHIDVTELLTPRSKVARVEHAHPFRSRHKLNSVTHLVQLEHHQSVVLCQNLAN